jgi:hypothetical protein
MKDLIHITYGRPDKTCRKTITLNGGPFNEYEISLIDIHSLAGLLRRIGTECSALNTPAVGHPHRLTYELNVWQPGEKAKHEAIEPFELPSLDEMAAYMDAEMARLGIRQPGATV